MPARKVPMLERFARHTRRAGECLLWTGAKFPDGRYGKISVNKVVIGAHRAIWEHFNGPTELQVLHKCDIPLCVNIDHLFVGTHQDNMDDKVNKQRQVRGERQNFAKLNSTQIKEIREIYKNINITQQELAELYGVNQTTISAITRGASWKQIGE